MGGGREASSSLHPAHPHEVQPRVSPSRTGNTWHLFTHRQCVKKRRFIKYFLFRPKNSICSMPLPAEKSKCRLWCAADVSGRRPVSFGTEPSQGPAPSLDRWGSFESARFSSAGSVFLFSMAICIIRYGTGRYRAAS